MSFWEELLRSKELIWRAIRTALAVAILLLLWELLSLSWSIRNLLNFSGEGSEAVVKPPVSSLVIPQDLPRNLAMLRDYLGATEAAGSYVFAASRRYPIDQRGSRGVTTVPAEESTQLPSPEEPPPSVEVKAVFVLGGKKGVLLSLEGMEAVVAKEGDTLPNGLKVLRIEERSVQLLWKGRRIRVEI